jgi:hypothetical protein
MFTLYFTRKFTSGLLKGLVHHDSITGPSAEKLVSQWAIGTKRCNYIIVDASFQKYAR